MATTPPWPITTAARDDPDQEEAAVDGGASAPPDPAALEQVRRDLAALGTDAASAPEVPAAVTERVVAALRSARAARDIRVRMRYVVAAVGVGAALAAVGVGTAMLLRPAAQPANTTVASPANDFPLSEPQLVALLNAPPDLGPLADPRRRAACLAALGYPTSATVLGAAPTTFRGQPAVVLLMPGDGPRAVNALAVRPNCSSVDTGLLADTTLNNP